MKMAEITVGATLLLLAPNTKNRRWGSSSCGSRATVKRINPGQRTRHASYAPSVTVARESEWGHVEEVNVPPSHLWPMTPEDETRLAGRKKIHEENRARDARRYAADEMHEALTQIAGLVTKDRRDLSMRPRAARTLSIRIARLARAALAKARGGA